MRQARKAEDRLTLIDKFLQSLANDQGERSVGVIFSGAGSDGALGLRAVAAAGGLTMVQHPESAQHEGMPQSASETGVADHVLPPDKLAVELLAHAAQSIGGAAAGDEKPLLHEVSEVLPEVCNILLDATGHSFKHYKTSTLIRRTLRRIQVLRVARAVDYLDRLRGEPAEAERLFTELLINVTAFFRDPEAFASLAKNVLPKLIEANEGNGQDPVRIWVPGCATGEEAYTLAMLLIEALDGRGHMPEVQVFATDIDDQALNTARQGTYPQDIAQHVSAERLRRFFVKKGQRYQIAKEVREMVVFSVHNVINDPPFLRLDLISCRNLLIYLGAHLQKKLIPLFHYALKPGGFLFLGPSETLNTHRELFRPVDVKHRISQRLPTALRSSPLMEGRSPHSPLVRNAPVAPTAEPDAFFTMQRVLLEEFTPKAVVVNEEGQVLSASGNLDRFLAVTGGAFHNSVTRLVRDGLRVALRAALSEATKLRRKVVHRGLSLRTVDGVQRITLTIQPLPPVGDEGDLFLVVFEQEGQALPTDAHDGAPPNEVAANLIEQLERDLATTREDLEKTVQDLESANEELKSSNEELLSMNEELQSANEELESSKQELQEANDALSSSNNDLENLLASTRIATLFLDEAVNVRRITPAVDNIYNLYASDIGRPLSHFTHKAKEMPPLPPARVVYTSERPIEDEVQMEDGSWYLRRVLPYRSPDGAHDGIVVTFIDVTERKRYEERLRYQLDLTRCLTDNATTAIFMMDQDGVCTFANPAALQMTGYTREELVGHSLHEKVHYMRPDGSPYPKEACPLHQAQTRGNQPRDHQDVFVRKDGIFFPVVCNTTLIDEAGAPRATVVEVRDVTEERRWAEALRESEARLRKAAADAEAGRAHLATLISGMSQGVVLMSPAGQVVRMNQAALAMHGFANDADSPTAILDFESLFEVRDSQGRMVAPKDRPTFRAIAGEEIKNVEMHVTRRATDKSFVGLYSSSVVRSPEGEVQFSVLAINNVTERFFAEEAVKNSERAFSEAIRQREQELRTLTDNTPLLLTRFDRDLRHVFVNAAAESIVRRTRDEILGKTNRQLNMPPELCDLWEGAISRVFTTGEPQTVEFTFPMPEGLRHFVSRLVPEVGPQGEVQAVVGVTQDNTVAKTAEEHLHEAARRKDEFLATLAHELRNPLAPIRTGLQVLKLSPPGEPAAERVRAMMERQLTHMVRLVDDLLDVSRISRGKLELKRERVNLRSVLEAALEVSRPLIEAAHHDLALDLPDEPIWIEADPTRVAQAVGNLLNNAAKYTPEKGQIRLSATASSGKVVVCVQDNGTGIPSEMLPGLFDMFTQVGRTLDRAQGGLGIGLSLVKQLVEMHGGSITAHSEGAGRGSSFTLCLPLPEATASAAHINEQPAEAAPSPAPGRKVLVVDDNVDAAESLAMVLEITGYVTRTAHSGADALELAAAFRPDVVFLDIGLPGMDGHEVARRLRKDPAMAQARLIALTGWGSEADKQRSREAGFDHHLTKPVEPAAVQALLASLAPGS